jgi:serine/threonine protein kinase
MWSLGCLAVEMLSGEPLFPGKTEHEQFCLIQDMLGRVPDELVGRGTRQKVSRMFIPTEDMNGWDLVDATGFASSGRTLEEIVKVKMRKGVSETDYAGFVDFVGGLLRYDAGARTGPREALEHAWFKRDHRDASVMTDRTCVGVKNVASEVYDWSEELRKKK